MFLIKKLTLERASKVKITLSVIYLTLIAALFLLGAFIEKPAFEGDRAPSVCINE